MRREQSLLHIIKFVGAPARKNVMRRKVSKVLPINLVSSLLSCTGVVVAIVVAIPGTIKVILILK